MSGVRRPWLAVYGGKIPATSLDLSLTAFLEEAVGRYHASPVMSYEGRELSYDQLLELSGRFAAALAARGVRKGDRVALMLPNSPEYLIAFFAVARLGAIVTQVNPIYVGRELAYILQDACPQTIVAHAAAYPAVRAARDAALPLDIVLVGEPADLAGADTTFEGLLAGAAGVAPVAAVEPAVDLAVIQYTGGTTGLAKGAALTHRNLLANIEGFMRLTLADPERLSGGKSIAVAPFCHIFGLVVVLLTSVRYGMQLLPVQRFKRDELLELIQRERPVMLAGVATIFTALDSHPDLERYGLDAILLYASGGASVPAALLHSFERRTGRPIYESYGLSEGAPVTANTFLRGPVAGSIGVPLPGTDVRIVDLETGTRELPAGTPGELVVRGPQVMQGYWNKPEETGQALRDGWLYTGDIARMDEHGYVSIVDRKKDVIIASGYKVYPREVEEVLYQHPAVVESVVLGLPDPYRGETVKAFVVCAGGSTLTADMLVAFCRERLAPYKVPTSIEFRDALPKSGVGKLLRRALIEEEEQRRRAQSGA